MDLKSLVTPGVIAGILSFLGVLSSAFKMPALGAFLSDPETANQVTLVISGGLGVVAGLLKGIKGTPAVEPPKV